MEQKKRMEFYVKGDEVSLTAEELSILIESIPGGKKVKNSIIIKSYYSEKCKEKLVSALVVLFAQLSKLLKVKPSNVYAELVERAVDDYYEKEVRPKLEKKYGKQI